MYIKSEETNIFEFLSGNKKSFIIPPFQRNYKWEEKDCRILFEDLIKSIERDNAKHYLGNIIYYSSENDSATFNESIIVDGQQRITTLLLLLCALRDVTIDEDIKESITEDYLMNKKIINRYPVRLKQTDYDDEGFKKIVESNFTSEVNNTNMLDNYYSFKEWIKEENKKNSNITPEVIFNGINNLIIISIKLNDTSLEDIQTIFEKINSTGKKLEQADLLRNYLIISKNADEQTLLYKKWSDIENVVGIENISEYIKDYLLMKICKDVKDDETYSEFKKYIEEKNCLGTMY